VPAEVWGYVGGALITMFLGGLWHGARWTMVIWGILHGVYLSLSVLTKRMRRKMLRRTGLKKTPRLHKALSTIFTFSLVNIGWIFFRADSLSDAWYVMGNVGRGTAHLLKRLFGNLIFQFNFSPLPEIIEKGGMAVFDFWVAALGILVVACVEYPRPAGDFWTALKTKPWPLRLLAYYLLVMAILLFSVFELGPFIYFQF